MSEETETSGAAGQGSGEPSTDGGLDQAFSGVSRRSVLGLGGLVATGGVLGSSLLRPSGATARQLDGDLDCNGYDLRDVGALGGDVTDGQRLSSLAGRNLSITDGRLDASTHEVSDEVASRLDDAITRLEVVGGTANSWRVGPSSPDGGYHRNGTFGLLFETDRPAYLGECTIDADSAGRFTPALYEYDREADELGARVDTITVRATGGPQTIFLDFLVDEPGTYLLTRLVPTESSDDSAVPDDLHQPADDAIALRRLEEYGTRFESDSRNGVTFEGGHNPYAAGDPVGYYYYYFDLEVSSARS